MSNENFWNNQKNLELIVYVASLPSLFSKMPYKKFPTKETDSVSSELNLLHDSYKSKYKSDLLSDLEFLTDLEESKNFVPPSLIGNKELFFIANKNRSFFKLIINYSVLDELNDKQYSQIVSQIETRLKVVNSFLENKIQTSNTNNNIDKEVGELGDVLQYPDYGTNKVIIKAFIKNFDPDDGVIDIQFESVRLNLCGYAPFPSREPPVKEPVYFKNDESERARKILDILNET